MQSVRMRMLGLLLIVLAAGCAEKPKAPKDLVPVEGLVTLDQKPLAGVAITFAPDSGEGASAAGISDATGRFRLVSFPSDEGAKPGNYKVIVIRRVAGEYSPEPVTTPADPRPIPAVYGAATSTPLRATVPSSGPITLDLKSNP